MTIGQSYEELAEALELTMRLLDRAALVAYTPQVQDYLPYGLSDDLQAYVQNDTGRIQQMINAVKRQG